MEFHVTLNHAPPDTAALEAAFRAVDPAALVDVDPAGHTLRIAAAVNAADVRHVLALAGCEVPPERIEPQPSVCCGGCSG